MIKDQHTSSNFDAVLGLGSCAELGGFAYVLAKFTYTVDGGQCRLCEPEPLLHDPDDPATDPKLHAATDFWPYKPFTDFVVRGSCHAPGDEPVRRMVISARIGRHGKEIVVFGRREIRWRRGHVYVEEPEPLEEVPVTYENAYGGIDWRVPVENDHLLEVQMELLTDHPGMYPRNPFGKGYLVLPDPVEGMEMPQLEDPRELLTAERIITADPRLWYRQPLPWCFDWAHPAAFPRILFVAGEIDAWYPAPQDESMPEVARGFLPLGYRTYMQGRSLSKGPDPRFYQGGSLGFVLNDVRGDEPVTIQGMHPQEPVLEFCLPGRFPVIEMEVEKERERVRPRIYSVICYPGEKKVALVYGAVKELNRVFVPGIHSEIPISARVNGGERIRLRTEGSLLLRLREAMAGGGGEAR